MIWSSSRARCSRTVARQPFLGSVAGVCASSRRCSSTTQRVAEHRLALHVANSRGSLDQMVQVESVEAPGTQVRRLLPGPGIEVLIVQPLARGFDLGRHKRAPLAVESALQAITNRPERGLPGETARSGEVPHHAERWWRMESPDPTAGDLSCAILLQPSRIL